MNIIKIKYKEKYIKLIEEKLIYQSEYNKYNRARRRASDRKRRAIKLKSKPNWLRTKDLKYIKKYIRTLSYFKRYNMRRT